MDSVLSLVRSWMCIFQNNADDRSPTHSVVSPVRACSPGLKKQGFWTKKPKLYCKLTGLIPSAKLQGGTFFFFSTQNKSTNVVSVFFFL